MVCWLLKTSAHGFQRQSSLVCRSVKSPKNLKQSAKNGQGLGQAFSRFLPRNRGADVARPVSADTNYAEESERESVPFSPASPYFVCACAVGFGLTSLDLFSPISMHVLQTVDLNIHEWVVQNVPEDTRRVFFDKWVSVVFITPELVLWPVLWLVASVGNKTRGGAIALLSSLSYALGGAIPKGDPILVDSVKNFFHRARPSGIHRTFSFPSGHTTSSLLLTGAILFVLLPAALTSFDEGSEGDSGGSNAGVGKFRDGLVKIAPFIWGAAYVTTAVGRVGADAHWFSDTLGGLFVGGALVSLLTASYNQIGRMIDDSDGRT